MISRFYDKSQPLRALAQTAGGLGEVFTNYAQRQYQLQTAEEYNDARTSMLRETNTFLLGLETDPDYKNYLSKFEDFQQTAYDKINSTIGSQDAQRQFERDWKLQAENLRFDVQKLSLNKGWSIARGKLVLDLDTIIDQPPSGTLIDDTPVFDQQGEPVDKRAGFVSMQKGRIQDLLNTAVVGGYLDETEHLAMMSKYVHAFEQHFITNEALKMIRAGEDIEDVEQWIIDQRFVPLGVFEREDVIRSVRTESDIHQARLMDQQAAVAVRAERELLQTWADPEQWQFLSTNNYKAILDAPISWQEKETWIDKIDRRIQGQADEVAAKKASEKYRNILQGYSAELFSLSSTDNVTDLTTFQEKILDDTSLEEVDRRHYLTQASQKIAVIHEREAKDEEARLKAEEERRQAELHIAEWRDAENHVLQGTLTKQLIDSYKTFDDADHTIWYNELEKMLDKKEADAAKVDPYKTQPAVEDRIFKTFWDPTVSHEVVERQVIAAAGDGLSFADAEGYLKDLPRRDQLLRDPLVIEYGDTLEKFFNSQYYGDMTDQDRGAVAMEHAAAMAAFRALNNDPKQRGLPEHQRRVAYEELLKSIVNRPVTRKLGNLFRSEVIELYTPQRLKSEWEQGGSIYILEQQRAGVQQLMRADYVEKKIGPTAYVIVLDDLIEGYIVYLHTPSGTYFRKRAADWELGKMERGEIEWLPWRQNRLEKYIGG